MPRTNIPVTTVIVGGVARPAQTTGDPTNDHEFTNDGRTFLEIENGDAASQTVTILTSTILDGLELADLDIVLTAGAFKVVGPFNTARYNQLGDPTKVYVNVADADVKFRAYSLP